MSIETPESLAERAAFERGEKHAKAAIENLTRLLNEAHTDIRTLHRNNDLLRDEVAALRFWRDADHWPVVPARPSGGPMGCLPNITATQFPKQGAWLGKRAKVLFHYGGPELMGTYVRDDSEEPLRTIIRLDDGRYVLTTECQHQPQD